MQSKLLFGIILVVSLLLSRSLRSQEIPAGHHFIVADTHWSITKTPMFTPGTAYHIKRSDGATELKLETYADEAMIWATGKLDLFEVQESTKSSSSIASWNAQCSHNDPINGDGFVEGAANGKMGGTMHTQSHDCWAGVQMAMGFVVTAGNQEVFKGSMETALTTSTRAGSLGTFGFNAGWKGIIFGATTPVHIAGSLEELDIPKDQFLSPVWSVICDVYLVETQNQIDCKLGGDKGSGGGRATCDVSADGEIGSDHWLQHEPSDG